MNADEKAVAEHLCPFCGSKAKLIYDGGKSEDNPHHGGCWKCGCAGPGTRSKGDALAAFTNPAHALAASRAEVERLRAVLSQIVEHREREDLAWEARCKWMAGLARAAQGGGT